MACDMLLALDLRQHGVDPAADLLDSRRRLERLHPGRAAAFHESLFAPPGSGIVRLARYLETTHREALFETQREVLDYLLKYNHNQNNK
jgi:hypothetical protein